MLIRYVCLLLLLSVPLVAQVRDVTKVEVVEVPVYVTDRGNPVAGLSRENFELFVNGKPQTIDYFDTLDFAELPGEPRPRQRRLYVLLFDLDSDPFALIRARRAVDAFVPRASEADAFAVATLGGGRLQVVLPFTSNRSAIHHAVRNVRAETRDPLRLAFASPAPVLSADVSESLIETAYISDMNESLAREPELRRVFATVGALEKLARELAPLEGHKHVVLLSSGFDSTMMFGGRRAKPIADVQHGPASMTDLIGASMQLPAAGAELGNLSSSFIESLDDLSARYASASVFLDAVDIAGIRNTIGGGNKDSLHLLARTGTVIANRNDLGQALQFLADSQRRVYVLGFRARDTGKDENEIRVRLRDVAGRPRISYRRSYSTTPAHPDASDTLFLADVVTNDIPQNGITLGTSVAVDRGVATVSVAIPGQELLAFGDEPIQAEALLYIFSRTSAVAFRQKLITIDPRRARALANETLRLRESFDLPPGAYAAKVLLRVEGTDARGFSRSDFVVEATQ